VLLGNSRVDVGINPNSDSMPAAMRPAYNLGQPGTGSEVSLAYLRHAMHHQAIENVIIAVDYFNFIDRNPLDVPVRTTKTPQSDLARLADTPGIGNLQRIQQRAMDAIASTLSLSATLDSLATIVQQLKMHTADIDESGFNSGNGFREVIRRQGQRSLFKEKNDEYRIRCQTRDVPTPSDSVELQSFTEILKLCKTNHIEVFVFMHPYHCDVLDVIETTGHAKGFASWKSWIALECESFDVKCYDFATRNRWTSEPTPSGDDNQGLMKWYWESGHYRSALGDLMLFRMFHAEAGDADFGIRLGAFKIEPTPTTLQR
jgi:hypothetical protein